jgi:hypothetical protein
MMQELVDTGYNQKEPMVEVQQSDVNMVSEAHDKCEEPVENAAKLSKRRFIKYGVAGAIVLVLAVVAAILIWYFTSRPKNIPVVPAAVNAESPPSLVKYGKIRGFSGYVSIDSTSLLANPSLAVNYWLTVSNNTNYPIEPGNNITLALTESNNLTSVASIGKTLLIPNIETRVFPYALPDDFEPKLWQGVAFLVGEVPGDATIVGSVLWSYDITVHDVSGGNTSSSHAKNATHVNVTIATSDSQRGTNTTYANKTSTGGIAMSLQNGPPTASPTTSGTISPTSSPIQLEAELCCSFTGRISLQYRVDIVNGVPTQLPYFLFENITVAGEPAPYLYLSHNPSGSPITASRDAEILIQGTASGSFTQTGTFSQDLPTTLLLDELPTFAGGSFTVWCTLYSVWLASGPLLIT